MEGSVPWREPLIYPIYALIVLLLYDIVVTEWCITENLAEREIALGPIRERLYKLGVLLCKNSLNWKRVA